MRENDTGATRGLLPKKQGDFSLPKAGHQEPEQISVRYAAPMDVLKMLADLRQERAAVEEAIILLERLALGQAWALSKSSGPRTLLDPFQRRAKSSADAHTTFFHRPVFNPRRMGRIPSSATTAPHQNKVRSIA